MVAVGSLDKIWIDIPQDVSEDEFANSFREYFGAEWEEVLDAVDMSFAYNSYNTAYFSIDSIKPIDNYNLDRLLEDGGLRQPPNVVVS